MNRRSSGILLHISSLPSPFGIGDFGPCGYRFADLLHATAQAFWQILPLTPTSPSHGNSPYSGSSAMAGNPILISPEMLLQDGLLEARDLEQAPSFQVDRVDYQLVTDFKARLLRKAYGVFCDTQIRDEAFTDFCNRNAYWLEDFALFAALKEHHHGAPWVDWPEELRSREAGSLAEARERFAGDIQYRKFLQYTFFSQWGRLKNYCHERSIQIIGDIPIYVDLDSSDCWANQRVFKLGPGGRPGVVAGVPPDYFSETGQRWGNPVFDWEYLRDTGYAWWIERVGHNLGLYDFIRLDHFRGLVGYWEIPASERTAVNGYWVDAPAGDFLSTLLKRFPTLPLLAEDLGVITPDVREVMKTFGFPGMRVLAFAFGADVSTNPYAPHNHMPDSVVYTGTHDNNTIAGWYASETSHDDRRRIALYLGREVAARDIHWEFVRMAFASVAVLAVVPMQDLLGLGREARMNIPGTPEGNWEWRLSGDLFTSELRERLLELTRLFGRA